MKILVLSDLNWHQNSKKIGRNDILKLHETQQVGKGDRFLRVNRYWNIITKEKPQVVLFAGDVTGDGSCGHGYQTAFFYLLSILEIAKLPTCFIKGDNDLEDYYAHVTENLSESSVQEISSQLVSVAGINIYGLSFQETNAPDLSSRLEKLKDYRIDILLCHCELKRRTTLINRIKTGMIITGHFDNKICSINNLDFISLSNDSQVINYATIDYLSIDNLDYTYHFTHPERRLDIKYLTSRNNLRLPDDKNSQLLINDVPMDIAEYEGMALPYSSYEKDKNALALAIKFLRGQGYKEAVEYLIKLKKGKEVKKKVLQSKMKKYITSKHKLSKTMLVDFLGHGIRKYFKK